VIAVVYLVWGPLGVEPVRRFFAAYRARPPGVDHELVLALNGLDLPEVDPGDRQELAAEIEACGQPTVALRRPVLDLAAYVQVAAELHHDRICFLNSHSEPLVDGWLAKLNAGLDEPGAGIAGATGSWFSNRSWVLHSLGLPSPYRGLLPDRAVARSQYSQMNAEHPSAAGADAGKDVGEHPGASVGATVGASVGATGADAGRGVAEPGRLSVFVRNLPALAPQLLWFDSFPACHLRTNAFIVGRARLRSLRTGRLASKMDTYKLESGSHCITAQLRAAGLRALVIDSAGVAYGPERWDRSRTLWQSDQQGLLVADNQTRLYADGKMDRRQLLSALAWGSRAEPVPPAERRSR
jgi:hypothetical protein